MSNFNIRKSLEGIYERLGIAAQTKALSFKTKDNKLVSFKTRNNKLDKAEDMRSKACIAILEDYSRNKDKYHNPEYNTPEQAFEARSMTILNNIVHKTIESEGRKIEIHEITEISTDDGEVETDVDRMQYNKNTIASKIYEQYESIEKNFSIKKLNDCIGKLPEKYREAIVLFKEGYSYNEIAEQIKIDLGKIHNYIFLARIKLAECLQLGELSHAH